jgi:hypothetical protein
MPFARFHSGDELSRFFLKKKRPLRKSEKVTVWYRGVESLHTQKQLHHQIVCQQWIVLEKSIVSLVAATVTLRWLSSTQQTMKRDY